MPRLRPAALLLASGALLASCGGASDDASAPVAAPKAKTAPLTVGGTGIRLGDATTGSGAGTQVLPNTKVPQSELRRDGVAGGADCAGADVLPSDQTIDEVVEATLCLLNGERAGKGLSPLSADAQLASAAKAHSQDMIRGQYFDHVARDGSTPVDRIRRTGYIPSSGRWVVGENLAWGTGVLATPENIVKAWMRSSGHRANILRGAYTQIGFGVYTGNPQRKDGAGATYTTTFGGKSGTTAVKSKRKRARSFKAKKARKARAARRSRARARA